jgi:hypothetical protein
MDELPSSAFRHYPELVTAFVENQLDDAGRAELANQIARLFPFHSLLPNPIAASLGKVNKSIGGDEALLRWLDDHPGRPRVTARLFRVIALLDRYSANSGVVQALQELRAHDPYPHDLTGYLLPDTTPRTLASLSQQIESLLAKDQLDEAGCLALRSLALLREIAHRAAELDQHATGLGAEVEILQEQVRPVATRCDDHDQGMGTS